MAGRIDLHVSWIITIVAEKSTTRKDLISELAAKLSPANFAYAA